MGLEGAQGGLHGTSNKQPISRADGGATAHRRILPSVPGDVYILVRVCRMSGLTRPRVLTFPPKLSAPPLAERVCIYFGWESLSSNGSRKRVQPEKCSLQTPRAPMGGGRSLCRGGWENCVRFSWLFIGEEAWEEKGNMGGKDFLCSLGSKACSPNTAKNGWSLSRSALHISFCYWLR